MKNNKILLSVLALCAASVSAQTVNKGELYISPEATFATQYTFENKDEASFKNNGLFYVYADIVNNGAFFDFKGKVPQGTTVLNSNAKQVVSGKSLTTFNNLTLDNTESQRAFDFNNAVVVAGDVVFNNGIAYISDTEGSLTFLNNAKAMNAKDESHVQGNVEKEGTSAFTFPIGDKEMYRYSAISAPKGTKDVYESKYSFDDASFFATHQTKAGVISQVNQNEYWLLQHDKNTNGDVVLTLSWDARTTPAELLEKPAENLHILRWDEKQLMWVDEGGIVDVHAKTVSTPTSVKGYGFFTLGTVKTDWMLEGDIVIYNYVSTTKPGENDYFLIDNINKFPNNKVEIFNRWGKRVYETSNYDSRGNVFKGYSEGRATISKGELLPTGTYYYVLTYEMVDANGSNTVKKAGYLHLETN